MLPLFSFAQRKANISRNEEHKSVVSIAAITGSYLLSKPWSAGMGLGKAFMDTANQNKNYQFTSRDWSTAIFFGYNIPLNLKRSLGLSASYEYNTSGKETSLSIDLFYGFTLYVFLTLL